MPAKSKAQQRYFGLLKAIKEGRVKNVSKDLIEKAKNMTKNQIDDFAGTKHKGLQEKLAAAYWRGFYGKCKQANLSPEQIMLMERARAGGMNNVRQNVNGVPVGTDEYGTEFDLDYYFKRHGLQNQANAAVAARQAALQQRLQAHDQNQVPGRPEDPMLAFDNVRVNDNGAFVGTLANGTEMDINWAMRNADSVKRINALIAQKEENAKRMLAQNKGPLQGPSLIPKQQPQIVQPSAPEIKPTKPTALNFGGRGAGKIQLGRQS
jgi:hypothetical protein